MEVSITPFVGQCLSATGALLAALPWAKLDAGVRKLIPKFDRADSGLRRLCAREETALSNKELAALNWLLDTDAKSLGHVKDRGIFAQTTTGIIAPASQLIVNEKNDTVGVISIAQRELNRRIRESRVYIGLFIMALGFILGLVGA